jgi:flagellar motor protein MotB
LPPPPTPAPAAQSAPPPATATPPQAAADFPSSSGSSQQIYENGSVIVNPDAVAGGGAPVTSRLLPSGESTPVALIFFGYGSSGLSRNDVNVLRDVARLHQDRGGLIRVIGHASQGQGSGDPVKQRLANFNISLARANAVARELSRLGVPTDQIQVAAAGAQQPIYYESSPTGEAGNRRVEIYLDY